MANSLFTNILEAFLAGTYDLDNDTVKVDLLDTADDNPNTSTDDFYDDITGAAVESTATLASTTITDGTFDSTDPTFAAVSGDQCEELLLWIDTGGAASTDPLVASYDTFASGMPVTPNSGDIDVSVNASGWFSL